MSDNKNPVLQIMQVRVPNAITDNNETIPLSDITGSPRLHSLIQSTGDGKYKVIFTNVDVDCPGGKCPVN